MFKFILKKETKLPKVFSKELSKGWRKLYSPQLLKVLEGKLNTKELKELYSLVFFLATEKNLQDAINYVHSKNYRKLSEMLSRVPVDYGERDYQTYDLIYIIGEKKDYVAIILDNDDGKRNIALRYITDTSPINLEFFLGRRLIYPV